MQVSGDWELSSLDFFQTDSTLTALVSQEVTPIPGDAVKAVATHRSCALLPGIQGTSEAFGGLGVFVLYPGSRKRDNRLMRCLRVRSRFSSSDCTIFHALSFCSQELLERCAKPLLKV